VQDLSGTLEVTVWPDVYDMTGDLWLAGSILLMKVRVRERGDRLTAGVQEVVAYVPDFEVPFWATPEALAESAPAPRRAGYNGNGGSSPGNGAASAARPEALEGPAVAPMREPPPVFDEAPEEDDGPPLDSPSIAEPRASYDAAPAPAALHLELRETEDQEADEKRLTSLFRLLREQPGADRVTLTIHTRGGEAIELALPSAKLDEALRESLAAALVSAMEVTT
jgi:hypothetical protein